MRAFTLLGVLILFLFVFMMGCSSYNGFVDLDENVNNSWGDVQNAYQRRADLIPNLVNTVKGQADFEKSTLESVTNARANATSVKIDPTNMTPENMKQFKEAQSQLSGALSKLLMTVERYPELKANKGFLELQSQLEGTENRIKVSRDKFNKSVTNYNKSVRKFPASFFASLTGFSKKSVFESDAGADKAPDVQFDYNK